MSVPMRNDATFTIAYRRADTDVLGSYQPGEPVYTYLAMVIDIAQNILIQDKTIEVLSGLALLYDSSKQGGVHFGHQVASAQTWVKWFIGNLITNFPFVIVDHRDAAFQNPGCLGLHIRRPWNGELSQFAFAMGANIHLNGTRVQHMVAAGAMNTPASQTRFKRFLFGFAKTMVHEVGTHALITWLNKGQANTPPHIGSQGYNLGGYGESGRYVETYLFGGTIEYYRDHGDNDQQAGIAHMVSADDAAAEIPMSVINDVCHRVIHLPIPCSATRVHVSTKQSLGHGLPVPDVNVRTAAARLATHLNAAGLRRYTIARRDIQQYVDYPWLSAIA